jgi:hypothetical protein
MNKKVNRRDFLKSSIVVGGASLTVSSGAISLSSCSDKNGPRPTFTYITPPTEIKELQLLENNFVKVQIFSNAVIEVQDKKNEQHWKTYAAAIQDETVIRESQLWGRTGRGMGEQFPGRFIGSSKGNKLLFNLYDRQHIFHGSFLCEFTLQNEWLSFQLLEVDESLPSLVFPPPFESDALVMPNNGGRLIRNDRGSIYSGIYRRQFLQFFNALGMRFIAGLKGQNGWICAFDVKSVDAGAMMVNGQITPAWIRSMGKWKGYYKVSYSFTGNGYVGIAKRYRQYAINNGYFKSLREKIADNPEVNKLLGGRALQFMQYRGKGYETTKDDYWASDKQLEPYSKDQILFTFKDVLQKVKLAEQKMGFKKGMVLLRGWMHGGYDSAHPDIWPIESKLGSEEEFKEILNMRDKYLTVLHDNYQDFYPTTSSFPNGVVVRKNGRLMSGGLWFGKQCYIMNSRDSVKFAKRNMERLKYYAPSGHYVDCVPNNPLHESYEQGNEQTRVQDMQNKFNILKVFHDQNLVIGSERFGDFCIPVLHWIEHTQRRIEGESIPIWQLVFHDAVFTCSYNTFNKRTPYPSWMEDMLYGNFLRFWMPVNFGKSEPYKCESSAGWGSWQYTEEEFKNTYHVDEWHQKIGLEEMTSHEFISDDSKIEEVIYGNKYKITVNFDNKSRSINGEEYKPYGYTLEG